MEDDNTSDIDFNTALSAAPSVAGDRQNDETFVKMRRIKLTKEKEAIMRPQPNKEEK